MFRFIQVIFSVKQQKFNKQAKTAITNTNFSNSRKMRGKSNNNIFKKKKKCVKQLLYISYYRQKIYITAGEKVTKITRRYSRSSLDNPVPDTFPRLEYRTKLLPIATQPVFTAVLQQRQLRKDAQTKITTNSNVKQTDKLGPKAAQSFVILPQGYQKTGIPDERMFGGDTLPDHEVRKPEADSVMFHGGVRLANHCFPSDGVWSGTFD